MVQAVVHKRSSVEYGIHAARHPVAEKKRREKVQGRECVLRKTHELWVGRVKPFEREKRASNDGVRFVRA